MIIIALMIYLSGVLVAYVAARKMMMRKWSEWTMYDRINNLLGSIIGSWIWLLAGLILQWMDKNADKPAKW